MVSGCWAAWPAAAWDSSSTQVRPQAQDRLAAHHARNQAAARTGRAVCDGAGGLRFRHQRTRHGGPVAGRRRRRSCRPLTIRSSFRRWSRPTPACCPTRAKPSSPASRAVPADRTKCVPWCRTYSTFCCRGTPTRAGDQSRTLRPAARRNWGFDSSEHEQIRADLRGGRIGLAQNRLPASADIRDVEARRCVARRSRPAGALPARSEWRRCARGVSPWSRSPAVSAPAGREAPVWSRRSTRSRSLPAVTATSSRSTWRRAAAPGPCRGTPLPHVITTSYLTHDAIAEWLPIAKTTAAPGPLLLSPGAPVGLRHGPHGARPEVRLGGNAAATARRAEAKNAREPARRAHPWAAACRRRLATTPTICRRSVCIPPGTGTRFPTCSATASCSDCSTARPELQYLMVHNIDTLGANVDPASARLAHRIGRGAQLRSRRPPL